MDAQVKRILVVSDGTGETASQIIRAAMVQFAEQKVTFTHYKNVLTENQIRAICDDADESKDLVVYTIVSPELRDYFHKETKRRAIPSVDLLGPLLLHLGTYFGKQPEMVAGILHGISERYFQRIEAVEYTVAHDDGKELTDLDQADLVILGISRTSKTPLSMYLSHHGWKICNVPMIRGFEIPQEVFDINQKRVIALTIQADELVKIRRARLQRLGQERGGEYADLVHVQDELDFAHELFKQNRRWAVFDVTGKALEETASEIVKLMSARGLAPPHAMGIFETHSQALQKELQK